MTCTLVQEREYMGKQPLHGCAKAVNVYHDEAMLMKLPLSLRIALFVFADREFS